MQGVKCVEIICQTRQVGFMVELKDDTRIQSTYTAFNGKIIPVQVMHNGPSKCEICEKSKGEPRLCLHTAYVIHNMCEMRMGKFVCSASIASFNHVNDQVNKILRQTWAAIF